LREELDIAAPAVISLAVIEHDYPDVRVRLHPFLCAYVSGEPKPLGCQELRWVHPRTLQDYQFPPANHDLIDRVASYLSV
jgi:mutator protein MutT